MLIGCIRLSSDSSFHLYHHKTYICYYVAFRLFCSNRFNPLLLLLYSFESFSHLYYPIVFQWSLSDNEIPLVFRNILSNLLDLNNAIVWIVSLFSDSQVFQSLFLILWGFFQVYQFQLVLLIPSCSIGFFSSLARSKYLSHFLLSFNFTLMSARTAKSPIRLFN